MVGGGRGGGGVWCALLILVCGGCGWEEGREVGLGWCWCEKCGHGGGWGGGGGSMVTHVLVLR